jgi:hypothetical protein
MLVFFMPLAFKALVASRNGAPIFSSYFACKVLAFRGLLKVFLIFLKLFELVMAKI